MVQTRRHEGPPDEIVSAPVDGFRPVSGLFAGQGATLTVEPAGGNGRLGFDWVEEGRYESDHWMPGRRLNGDQTHQGRHVRLPPGEFGVQRFRLYRY